jgi:hypothetical protein
MGKLILEKKYLKTSHHGSDNQDVFLGVNTHLAKEATSVASFVNSWPSLSIDGTSVTMTLHFSGIRLSNDAFRLLFGNPHPKLCAPSQPLQPF